MCHCPYHPEGNRCPRRNPGRFQHLLQHNRMVFAVAEFVPGHFLGQLGHATPAAELQPFVKVVGLHVPGQDGDLFIVRFQMLRQPAYLLTQSGVEG